MTDRLLDPLGRAAAPLPRGRLAAAADAAGLLDVGYDVTPSPIGPLLVAATGDGVVRLGFECEGHDAVLEELAGAVSPRVLRAPDRLAPAVRQLEEYFAGARRRFEVPVDLRLVGGFRRQVLERLAAVRYGTTLTYAQLAAEAGNPGAVRAAGSACARNPVPLVVPCHRVVRGDGTIGQYRGGSDAKRLLLSLENRAA